VSTVRLAATVILARPPLEVYLARRSSNAAFAPDAFVFPGGTVEKQDSADLVRARTLGIEPARVSREFRAAIPSELPSDEPTVDPADAATLFITALRELFEEAGVLFARTSSGRPIAAQPSEWDRVGAERVALRGGLVSFGDFLAAHDWYADACALALFSHWITPPSEPRRYNTHFFFGIAPTDQAALADASETHDGIWIAPKAALERRRAASLHLVYPTIKHLERLQDYDSVEDVLQFARRKQVLTIVPKDGADDFEIPATLENAW
jgi:recombination protein RecT